MKTPVEIIADGGVALAYLVDPRWMPATTQFLTPDDFSQQMGMIVYRAGEQIMPHVHVAVERRITGTTECIIVRKGRCEVDIYNSGRELICSRTLEEGAIILLLGGGHGFRMIEDTVLLEVKQGPYFGDRDKVRFPA